MHEGPEIGKSWREKRNRGGERLQSEREAGGAEQELGGRGWGVAIKSGGEGGLEVIGRRETDEVRLLLAREDGPAVERWARKAGTWRPQLPQSCIIYDHSFAKVDTEKASKGPVQDFTLT